MFNYTPPSPMSLLRVIVRHVRGALMSGSQPASLVSYTGSTVLAPPSSSLHSQLLDQLACSPECSVEYVPTRENKSFPELARAALCAGAWLRARGLQPGDHVLLFTRNHPHFVTSFLGTMAAGGVPCLGNPGFTEYELGRICAASHVKYIICGASNKAVAAAVSQLHL